MLIVLTTQLHLHSQPDDTFLERNPQYGWNELHSQAINQGVYLNTPLRAQTPDTHEEYIEDLSWIISAINFARANKSQLIINYRHSNVAQHYHFETTEPFVDSLSNLTGNDILAIDPQPKYIGIYDGLTHLQNRTALYYNLNQTFLNHSGRMVLTINVDELDSTITLFQKILSVALNKNDEIWIKSQAGKRYSQKFNQQEFTDYLNKNILSENLEDFLYTLQKYNEFIVSNYVDMSDEHRFFVVNNQIVEGSHHSPQLTPVTFRAPGYHRHLNSNQYKINQRLFKFAKKMVEEIKNTDEKMANTDYVLDVAFDSFGEPLIVEFNPLYNAGVYACNPQIIIDNLLKITNSGL